MVVGVEAEEAEPAGEGALGVGKVRAAWLVGTGPDGVVQKPPHAEDAVGVEERVGEKGGAVVPYEGGGLFGGGVVRVGEAGDGPVAAVGEGLDGGAVRGGGVGGVLGEVVASTPSSQQSLLVQQRPIQLQPSARDTA